MNDRTLAKQELVSVEKSEFIIEEHPLLQAWEAQRPPQLSPKEHEQNWSE